MKGCCVIKNDEKRISTANFESSSHQNVTAKNPICIVYFMYIDMPDFIAYQD